MYNSKSRLTMTIIINTLATHGSQQHQGMLFRVGLSVFNPCLIWACFYLTIIMVFPGIVSYF